MTPSPQITTDYLTLNSLPTTTLQQHHLKLNEALLKIEAHLDNDRHALNPRISEWRSKALSAKRSKALSLAYVLAILNARNEPLYPTPNR